MHCWSHDPPLNSKRNVCLLRSLVCCYVCTQLHLGHRMTILRFSPNLGVPSFFDLTDILGVTYCSEQSMYIKPEPMLLNIFILYSFQDDYCLIDNVCYGNFTELDDCHSCYPTVKRFSWSLKVLLSKS